MKKIQIVDLTPGVVKNVSVQIPESTGIYKENWFKWTATKLTAEFCTNKIVGGVLNAWKHTPIFSEMEYHVDTEMFYFVSGTALMPFADINDGKIDMDTVQIVRIKPGTQIIIQAGKAHFVAVAESDEPVYAVVVAPPMDAPRITMCENIEGI